MAKSSMKLLMVMDRSKGKRVLFAEAGKDCMDFLFHILSLPIATLTRLLQGQAMEGSLTNLYQSLDNLDDAYILPNFSKDTILKPLSSPWVPLLALNYTPTQKLFYSCNTTNTPYINPHSPFAYESINTHKHYCYQYVSDDPHAVCGACWKEMTWQLTYVDPPCVEGETSSEKGRVKGVVTYMVMDDLVVKPMSTISTITLLSQFNVKDVSALEEKVVDLRMKEALKLLRASLDSKTVLTDVFC